MTAHEANGKGFEFLLAQEAVERSGAALLSNGAAKRGPGYIRKVARPVRRQMVVAAQIGVKHVLDAERSRIGRIHEVRILEDVEGRTGETSDVLVIAKNGHVGISAKKDHAEIKHPRLSDRDVLAAWIVRPASSRPSVFQRQAAAVFTRLRTAREQGLDWADLTDRDATVFAPALDALIADIKTVRPGMQTQDLFMFLVGSEDHYRVTMSTAKKTVTVESSNFFGTLSARPMARPTKIDSIERVDARHVHIAFNNGFTLRLRAHHDSVDVKPTIKLGVSVHARPYDSVEKTVYCLASGTRQDALL